MKRSERIQHKIETSLRPIFLQIQDESSQHGRGLSHETHFRCIIVSSFFEGNSKLQRERTLYALLKEELSSGLHALSLSLFTPSEWENLSPDKKNQLKSPPCPTKDKSNVTL